MAAVIRDLVNTVEWQEDDESWTTPADLAAWMSDRWQPAIDPTEADLVLARRLREGLREILLGHAGHTPRRSAVEDLNDALRAVPVVLTFDVDGGGGIAPSLDDAPHALAPLVIAIHVARSTPGWTRLKACSRDTCRWAYWDASRNGAARWCSMQGCGNYVKMRRRNSPDLSAEDEIALAGHGARSTTLLDVAARVGVSIKTVSNVVHGAEHVAPSTRARVQQAIKELDYQPNAAARTLAQARRSPRDPSTLES